MCRSKLITTCKLLHNHKYSSPDQEIEDMLIEGKDYMANFDYLAIRSSETPLSTEIQ
jgi:hypothetical protein